MANDALLPITYIWDVQAVREMDFNSAQFKELLVRMYQNINLITTTLNVKDTGFYDVQPYVTGQQFYPLPDTPNFRPAMRLLVVTGQLPNAGTKSVPHGLTPTSAFTITKIYGAASDTTGKTYIPLPYASPTLANNIELYADATNVNIITGSDRTNFNTSIVVMEYIEF